jgi:alpha-D-ribose 1-methylphosphonate 5-triphosphate diphosphatase PhnM
MDDTPGQRQFHDDEKPRLSYRSKTGGLTDEALEALFAQRKQCQAAYAVTRSGSARSSG